MNAGLTIVNEAGRAQEFDGSGEKSNFPSLLTQVRELGADRGWNANASGVVGDQDHEVAGLQSSEFLVVPGRGEQPLSMLSL